jgi:hypothetical protein
MNKSTISISGYKKKKFGLGLSKGQKTQEAYSAASSCNKKNQLKRQSQLRKIDTHAPTHIRKYSIGITIAWGCSCVTSEPQA